MRCISIFLFKLGRFLERKSEQMNYRQKRKAFLKHLKKKFDEIQVIESIKGEIIILEKDGYSTDVEKVKQIWRDQDWTDRDANVRETQACQNIKVSQNVKGFQKDKSGSCVNDSQDIHAHKDALTSLPKIQIPGSSFVIDEIIFEKTNHDIGTQTNENSQDKGDENIIVVPENDVVAQSEVSSEQENEILMDTVNKDDIQNRRREVVNPFFGFRGRH